MEYYMFITKYYNLQVNFDGSFVSTYVINQVQDSLSAKWHAEFGGHSMEKNALEL